MNRTFIIVLIVLALGLAIYNITLLNFNNLFEGDSLIACIGVLASFCAIIILLIFNTSKRISEKLKGN